MSAPLPSAATDRSQRASAVGAPPRGSGRSLGIAVLAACLTLLAADSALRVLVSLVPTAHSYDVPRNPHFRRGWRDYTSPRERPEGSRLVIVISNSQGYLRENRDGALVYPARLEALLDQELPGEVIVANWSVAGGQAPEMIVLAARAAQHRPDAVVLVAGAGNFSAQWARYPLSFWLSDATSLAYDPGVRARLPAAFLERTSADDPLGWFDALSGMGAARRRFVEERDEAWTWRDRAPGELEARGRLFEAHGEAFTLGARRGDRDLSSEAAPIDPARAEMTMLLLGEFVRSLRETSPETRLLLVGMPFARPARPGALWRAAAAFTPVAERALADVRGVEVVEALAAVPTDLFVHETHLQPEGHALFARWLLPHVRRALSEPGPPG